jgi:hypothetical protein
VAEQAVGVPAGHVYCCIADFDRHHPCFLLPPFSAFWSKRAAWMPPRCTAPE